MSAAECERVISEWCYATGLEPWDVRDDAHVEIDGSVVGILCSPSESGSVLNVYCDLGDVDAPHKHAVLLADNVDAKLPEGGFFGIHPETAGLFFRARLHVGPHTQGFQLPGRIAAMLAAAREHLLHA